MFSPGGGLGQTIAVVDRSGKVVSTSKHLMNIFNEAKHAYNTRKAEISNGRRLENGRIEGPRRAQTYVGDNKSVASSRRSHRTSDSRRHSSKRRHSGDVPLKRTMYPESAAGLKREVRDASPGSTLPPSYRKHSSSPHRSPARPDFKERRSSSRSHVEDTPSLRPGPTRSMSTGAIDMDLAYGDIPPGLFASQKEEEAELGGLVGRVKGLLDEANCLQHSVTTTIATLQKNPDAMAAVALTLAEISNLLKKLGPSAMLGVRRAAPAVFALLSSPQFLIAAGVGVGITIVAFGGFKIVKKIQAKRAAEDPNEMLEIGADVSRIDTWRRGIAMAEAQSEGTSVEGEFISPLAANLSRLNLVDNDPKPPRSRTSSSIPRGPKSTRSVKTTRSSSSKASKPSKGKGELVEFSGKGDRKKKTKKPSPLRLMFS